MSARSRSLRTLLVTALGAATLGLYAWFGVMKGDERDAESKRNAERLVQPTAQPDGGTTPLRYERLAVKARGELTELERSPEGTWVVVRPFRAAADIRAVEDLVGALQFARLKSTVEEAPGAADLLRYGLDKPQVEVTASAGGIPPLTVKVGVDNPFDGSAYLQRGADRKVYAIESTTRAALDKATFDLRDKEVLAVPEAGLTRIEVTGKKYHYTLAREGGQPFAFVQPTAEAADAAAVSGWLAALKSDRATRFLPDSPADRARTGVERPDAEAVFRRGATETVRVRLAAGKKETDPVYALREDGFGASLSEIPRTALGALARSPAELRDRAVLHVDPQAVAAIRFQPGGGGAPLVVTRERPADGGAEGWRLTAPVAATADSFKLGGLLYTLTSLRIQATEDKLPADAATTGLGPGARSVVLEGAEGNVLGTLVVGKASGKPAGTFVRDDRGRIGVVETARPKEPPLRAIDLQPPPPPAPPDGGTAG